MTDALQSSSSKKLSASQLEQLRLQILAFKYATRNVAFSQQLTNYLAQPSSSGAVVADSGTNGHLAADLPPTPASSVPETPLSSSSAAPITSTPKIELTSHHVAQQKIQTRINFLRGTFIVL